MPSSPSRNSAEQRSRRARIAALARHNSPAYADESREHRADRLADYVRAVVDKAPPLSAAQRERVAAALRAPTPSREGEPAA